jgi:recombination protein RecT
MSTAIAESPPKQLTIKERLQSPAFIQALAEIVPQHCKPERMARIAITALTRTPKLAECDQASFFRCLMDLSQWGLEPDGRRAHLIPFENTPPQLHRMPVHHRLQGLRRTGLPLWRRQEHSRRRG